MANSIVDLKYLVLKDNWPEPPPTEHIRPLDFTGGVVANLPGQNSLVPLFQPGTKVRVLGLTKGAFREYSTLIYLKVGTQNTTVAIAAGAVCVPEDSDATKTIYQVTNNGAGTANEQSGVAAIALGAMTNTYHGWFWCGGRAPLDIAPGLNTTAYTNTSVAAGFPVSVLATDVAGGPIGFAKAVTLTGHAGFTVADDN